MVGKNMAKHNLWFKLTLNWPTFDSTMSSFLSFHICVHVTFLLTSESLHILFLCPSNGITLKHICITRLVCSSAEVCSGCVCFVSLRWTAHTPLVCWHCMLALKLQRGKRERQRVWLPGLYFGVYRAIFQGWDFLVPNTHLKTSTYSHDYYLVTSLIFRF